MREPFDNSFTGMRIEHHAPDGAVRALGATTMGTMAMASAVSWARRLGRQGVPGEVVIITQSTGRVLKTYSISPVDAELVR